MADEFSGTLRAEATTISDVGILMKKSSGDDSRLRRAAEKKMRSQAAPPEEIFIEDAKSLIHELRVHQIELEMQNDELHRSQIQLAESRMRYADLYDFAPVGYLTFDQEGLIVEANLTAAKQLGKERSRILKSPFFLNVSEKDRDAFRLHLTKVFKTGERQTCELRLAPAGIGEEFHAKLDSILIEDASGKGLARTSVTDITEGKRVEVALSQREYYLTAILENQPGLVWLKDKEGRFLAVNHAFARSCGMERPENVLGKTDLDIWPRELAEKYRNDDKAVLTRGAPIVVEEPINDKGEMKWFETFKTPVLNKDGQILGTSGYARDITERKQMEEELRKSRYELELRVQERTAELNSYMAMLEQSNRALQDFASIASHDLQEPLRKVKTFGNILKQQCSSSLDDQGKDYLDRILNANQRMQSLLTGLLDYSRVTTKTEPFQEVDLSALIGQVLSDLEVRIVQTGGEVHIGRLPVISADPTQMRQLFQNLIGNALKFHKPDERPMVHVRAGSDTDSGCQIVIEDNGIGFEEQYLERIFAPFQRLHGRSSQYEGTGMGLAICQKIVERHGGSITARSEPGKGSTFIVTLVVNAGKVLINDEVPAL